MTLAPRDEKRRPSPDGFFQPPFVPDSPEGNRLGNFRIMPSVYDRRSDKVLAR